MNWDDDFFDCMDSSFCGCCCGGIERSMMLRETKNATGPKMRLRYCACDS